MLLNQPVIQKRVLKNTIIEEIFKVKAKLNQISLICNSIEKLTVQIKAKQSKLQLQKYNFFVNHQKVSCQRQSLKQQFQSKLLHKQTQYISVSAQMKNLNQSCSFIREKKRQLNQLKSVKNKLINYLEQIEVHLKQSSTNTQKLQFSNIQEKKIQGQLLDKIKQFLLLLEVRKNEIYKENDLKNILIRDLTRLQNQSSEVQLQINTSQVNTAQLSSDLNNITDSISKLQNQITTQQLNLFNIGSKQQLFATWKSQGIDKMNANNEKSTQITQKIQQIKNESAQINKKIIKTREFIFAVNSSKNIKKKVNQQLKLKLRELMKIALLQDNISTVS